MKHHILNAVIITLLLITSCTTRSRSDDQSGNDTLRVGHIFPFQSQHCHGSSVVELPNRDLLVVWFQGSGERTADDVAIMGSRRDYRSGEWCESFIMADVPGFPDINPVVFIDGKSRLWLVWYTVMAYQWESSLLKYRISENYMQKTGPPEWKWQDMIHVKPDGSVPDGISRNDPFVLNLKKRYDEYYQYLLSAGSIRTDGTGPIKQEMWDEALRGYFDIAKGTSLMAAGNDVDENGEIIRTRVGYPLMRRIGWQTRNKPLFTGGKMLLPLYSDGFDFSLIAIFDEKDESWSFSEPIVGAGPVQPALALQKEGSVVAFMRDNGPPPKRLMRSVSHDTGLTWSIAEDSDIPNPGSGADIIVTKSGNWILAHNDTELGRHRLSVWLSQDEGRTWPFRKSIIEGVPGSDARAHYPAITEGSGGMLHVSFTNQVPGPEGQPSVKNISLASFPEKWIMSGK